MKAQLEKSDQDGLDRMGNGEEWTACAEALQEEAEGRIQQRRGQDLRYGKIEILLQ